MKRIALAMLLTACVDEPHGTAVKGSPADVRTLPGDYPGYRVGSNCETTNFAVIGTGTIEIVDDAVLAAGRELAADLADVESIWGSGGFSLGCEPGVGTSIDLDDWRDVDEVIARTGEWLRARDYRLQVGILVESAPHPLETD